MGDNIFSLIFLASLWENVLEIRKNELYFALDKYFIVFRKGFMVWMFYVIIKKVLLVFV
jgi:hypothetical protein